VPVESLGPITLPRFDWDETKHKGNLKGGGRPLYVETGVPPRAAFAGRTDLRSAVAYDNKRMLVELGGYYWFASFDGGKTWGGIDGKSPGQPTLSYRHGLRHGGLGACYYSGDAYTVARGWMAAGGCNTGAGISRVWVEILRFMGDRWERSPMMLLDHHARGCPISAQVVQLRSGRIWAFWDAGRLGRGIGRSWAKFSDDDGLHWRFPGRYPENPGLVNMSRKQLVAVFKEDVAFLGDGMFRTCDGNRFTEEKLPCTVQSAAGTPGGRLAVAGRKGGLFSRKCTGWEGQP